MPLNPDSQKNPFHVHQDKTQKCKASLGKQHTEDGLWGGESFLNHVYLKSSLKVKIKLKLKN